MAKKEKTPAELAMIARAWRGYYEAFERAGLPMPEEGQGGYIGKSPAVSMRVMANGMYCTVSANGRMSPLASWKEQWAECLRDLSKAKATTLHRDSWAAFNKADAWK